MSENNLDDSLYGNWKKIVGNINHKREMENQRKNLVEEIKEMSRSPNRNPQPKVGETETAGRNEGEAKGRNEPETLRRSGRVETKRGERTRTLAQKKTGWIRS